MYISQIKNNFSFTRNNNVKYEQPSLKKQLPSMALGFVGGGLAAGIYCKHKNIKGKKLGWSIVETASSCALFTNIIYLLTHPPKKAQ